MVGIFVSLKKKYLLKNLPVFVLDIYYGQTYNRENRMATTPSLLKASLGIRAWRTSPLFPSLTEDNAPILDEPDLKERARRIADALGNHRNADNVLAYLRDEDH